MAITTRVSSDGKELVVNIKGRFDFSCHQEFRKAYEDSSASAKAYAIDMKDTTYLDSSALGMLLLLRDHAGGDNAHIRILNCNNDVRKILSISNFEQLFTIQ